VPRLPPSWAPPVAQHQRGLFTAAQARAAGASADQVRRRLTAGTWARVAGDALALTGTPLGPTQRADAVGLTWPDAIACLTTAARFHRLPVPDDAVEHAVVARRTPSRGGIVTHRYALDPGDVVSTGRALVTTRARTLLDCVGRLPADDAERLVVWATTRELLTADALEAALTRGPRWGDAQRRLALADVRRGTLSAAERRLHRILRRAGLIGWRFDQVLRDDDGIVGRADVLFAAERLVVEVDGFEHHAFAQFQADRDKQNRLMLAGYTVLRFTWADLTGRPTYVADQIARTLVALRAR
jgi:very-short-patch-repair endonuclease